MNDLPTGTITFLFTDIEGSTQLWERYPEAMQVALARHDDQLRQAIESHRGRLIKTTGDGVYAIFASAADALSAAVVAQRTLLENRIPNTDQLLRVRMGLHTGEAGLRDGDYHGSAVNRAARIMSIGHGGQILISAATAGLLVDSLPSGIALSDLGEHRLRGLSRPEHIYQLNATGLPDLFPPLRADSVRVISLPQQATGFIGRREEVNNILRLFGGQGARLVTLIGPGGMGKTRLAIQAAATLGETEPERFPDGIFFVPLAPVNTSEGMTHAIATSLGFKFKQQAGDPQRQLLAYLLPRSILLILDNMEQLLAGGAAELTAELIDTAPNVCLLVTSRSRLGLRGEQRYEVPGMSLPEPSAVTAWAEPALEAEQYSGLRLFRQAAGRVQPGFRLTRDNIADVTRIGHQVQGMPLGIELAAGWLELISPAEIATEIDRSLDLLATDLRGVPDRQRSMRAVFETTWTLLSDKERRLLPALAVFRAPFTREAAEVVAGAGIADLMSLANKSWLQRIEGSDRVSRYQVHELLRQYAEVMLRTDPANEVATRRRFADFYADALTRSTLLLRGAEQMETMVQIRADLVHIRQAWYWFLEQGDYESLTERMLLPLYFLR